MLRVKNLSANAGDIRDAGLIPGWGRSPGGGHGNPHQYLAWRIPWTEEPGRQLSKESQRGGHYRSDLAHTHEFKAILKYSDQRRSERMALSKDLRDISGAGGRASQAEGMSKRSLRQECA